MSVKIRLQRHGRKKAAFFHIVVADSRAPRNGRFIEKLGIYNPNTNPATIDLNFDSTLDWVQKGAIPTDTARAILSYKGVMMKHHLLSGVAKGALTAEQVEEKFAKWLDEKVTKVETKVSTVTGEKQSKRIADLEREAKISAERAAKIAAKNAPEVVIDGAAEETVAVEATAEGEVEATTTEETPVAEAPVETPVAETPAVETPVAETPATDAPAEEEAK
jgi:small subunit ribosomal protein S16